MGLPSSLHVMWQEFSRRESERVEKEFPSNGKPSEPVRDMGGLRAELHREHG